MRVYCVHVEEIKGKSQEVLHAMKAKYSDDILGEIRFRCPSCGREVIGHEDKD